MGKCSCQCKYDCVSLAVAASIIIGIIAAILRYTAVIAVTPAFLWVVFGIAIVYLAVLLVSSAAIRAAGVRDCVCSRLPAVLTGVLGTVLTAVILLAVPFAATSALGAIITGVLLFSFALLITTTACLIKCAVGCNIDDEE